AVRGGEEGDRQQGEAEVELDGQDEERRVGNEDEGAGGAGDVGRPEVGEEEARGGGDRRGVREESEERQVAAGWRLRRGGVGRWRGVVHAAAPGRRREPARARVTQRSPGTGRRRAAATTVAMPSSTLAAGAGITPTRTACWPVLGWARQASWPLASTYEG